MTALRRIALALLLAVGGMSLFAGSLSPASYRTQFRGEFDSSPSRQHPLGTDAVGRDRLARLLYGTRISLTLAPAAAAISTILGVLLGGFSGYIGGSLARLSMAVADLFLSLPWLFLLITVRALMPLNVSPFASVAITFLLLGLLGWAASARVLCAASQSLRNASFVLQARASGIHGARLFLIHVLPNLKPILLAQFWISIPVFVLSEANLSILGLGVTEPLPSWGSMLRELEGMLSFRQEPWKLAPLFLLVLVVTSFQLVLSTEETAV